MDFAESLLRGKAAETIVSEMFREAGYLVYHFGYELMLQNLIQKGLPKMNKGNVAAEKLRTMPDFIVMKDGNVSLLEVKFRRNGPDGRLKEWADWAGKYWPEAHLIIVRADDPCFFISTIQQFADTGQLHPLAEDSTIRIEPDILKQYAELVCRYCHPPNPVPVAAKPPDDF